jgi:hypothetical protein
MGGPQFPSGASEGVVHDEKYYGTNDGDHEAIQVQARDAWRSEFIKDETTDDGADDSEQDVEDNPFSALVHDFASDETGQQAEYDPS